MAVELMSIMDNSTFGQHPSMSTVSTYLSAEPYAGNTGQYYGGPPSPLSYTYSQSPPSLSSTPSNLTLFSCSERAIAKERRRQQNRVSQRAYRKRKDSAVKGLHDSIRELQQGAETLKSENGGLKGRNDALQAELERLLAENDNLKRKRSMSQFSPSQSSASRRSSCTRCSDAGLACDRTGSLACQRCERANTACTSQGSQLNASLTPASEPMIDPQGELQSNGDLDFEGIFTFYNDLDETEPGFISPPTASGEFRDLAFSPFVDTNNFILDQQANSTVGGYLKPAGTHTLSAVRNSRPSVAEEMSRSDFETFVGRREPNLSLAGGAAFDGMSMSDATRGSNSGLGGELSDTTNFGKRRKASLEPKLL